MKQNNISLGKLAPEILNNIANDNRKCKTDTELDLRYKKLTETITALDIWELEEDLIGPYYDGIKKGQRNLRRS